MVAGAVVKTSEHSCEGASPATMPFFAEIAQQAERNLPTVEAASSKLAFRSIIEKPLVARLGVESSRRPADRG